jgi:hypothetical protein
MVAGQSTFHLLNTDTFERAISQAGEVVYAELLIATSNVEFTLNSIYE